MWAFVVERGVIESQPFRFCTKHQFDEPNDARGLDLTNPDSEAYEVFLGRSLLVDHSDSCIAAIEQGCLSLDHCAVC